MPIGKVESPYKEKFGIPRQPGLAPSIISRLVLESPFNIHTMVKGLEGCSHIWVLFIFSKCVESGWKPTVRPPRLGGNEKMGVFATRSPYRPNSIGLSPVKLLSIEHSEQGTVLIVSGSDLLEGTPIIDIKPYIPYADNIQDATCNYANSFSTLPQPIEFSNQALLDATQAEQRLQQPIKQQITELLKCDPRPAYKKDGDSEYGIRLHDLNIRFKITESVIYVHCIERVDK